MDEATEMHIAHCSSCGCMMDISAMEPYTNVVCPDCGHHTRVKCELGNYLLVGRHAVGGMSMVFKALDTTLDREVAIKILNEEYSQDEQRMKQFEQEALITAAISHPHVVRMFTVGKAYGHFYIAMEMVSGENLEEKIARQGAIGEGEILPIVAEIISGLQAAKQAGLIHRDMKPGNILFDSNGHVKIVDFGLALVTQGGIAKADEVWATPYYVPPEALDGEEEDFRSDMYALGATLYHALSGQPSIPDDTKSSSAVRKAKESIEPLAKVAPWLKPETCHLVDRAMALKREDRFESYAEMEDFRALAQLAIEKEGAAAPIHSRERARRRIKEKIGMMSLMGIGLVALLLLAVVVVLIIKNKHSAGDDTGAEAIVGVISGLYTDEGDGYSPEVAARIGKQFLVSHQMLGEMRYNEAGVILFKLMDDQQVNEPAASWAGVEAVIATWLAGDTGEARVAIRNLREHMDTRKVSRDSRVRKLGDQLANPGVIRKPDIADDTMKIVHMMAVALKNWETGAWEVAVPLFEKVQKQRLPEGSPLVVYREIAKRYLADYETLQPVSVMPPPVDIREAHDRLAALKVMMAELKTRGRAKFHVGVWQLRQENHIRKLRVKAMKAEMERVKQKKSQVPSYQDQLAKFHHLVATSKFDEASKLLQGVSVNNGQQNEKIAWIYLSDSAGAFLRLLEEAVVDAEANLDIESIDGEKFQRVLGARQGGLRLEGGSGEIFVPWAKIKPESVLEIYTNVCEQTLDTLEGQQRTERAICYAWITAMKDKAKLAAGKLSVENENFAERWANTMQAHGQKP